jgi:hypothetical protein
MYNLPLKQEFLNEYGKDTARTYRNDLEKISEVENFYGKDVFLFSYDQYDNAFKSLNYKTENSIRRAVSVIKKYSAFANQKGLNTSKIDISILFEGEKLRDYMSENILDKSTVTRDEMYNICDQLFNPIDRAIVVLPFECIVGKEGYDILNLKYQDVNFDTGHVQLKDRSTIIKDRRTLDILEEAHNQSTYYLNNGNAQGKITEAEIYESDYFVKKVSKKRNGEQDDGDEIGTRGLLEQKITRIFKGVEGRMQPYVSDVEYLNMTNLFRSGYFDKCKVMTETKRSKTLDTNDHIYLCKECGISPKLASNYKVKWERYLEMLAKK